MINPNTLPNLPIKDLLNPADTEGNDPDTSIHYTQTVKDANDPRFKEHKQKEYDGMKAKVGVISYNRPDLPANSNIIGNRFILSIKDPNTQFERLKARWILLGHTASIRREIANNSPMLMRLTFRMIISFSVIFFTLALWHRDVEQAYVQTTRLTRHVFTEALPEANLPAHQLLKVVLSHYGLLESSSCFIDTYYPVFTEMLKMMSAFFDPCFLYQKIDDNSSASLYL